MKERGGRDGQKEKKSGRKERGDAGEKGWERGKGKACQDTVRNLPH